MFRAVADRSFRTGSRKIDGEERNMMETFKRVLHIVCQTQDLTHWDAFLFDVFGLSTLVHGPLFATVRLYSSLIILQVWGVHTRKTWLRINKMKVPGSSY